MALDVSKFKANKTLVMEVLIAGDFVDKTIKKIEIEKMKELHAELENFKEQLKAENKEIQDAEKRGETVSAERKNKWLQNYKDYRTCRTSVNFIIIVLKAGILNGEILNRRREQFRNYSMEQQLMHELRKDVLDHEKIEKWEKKITKLEEQITITNNDLVTHKKRINSLNISTPEGEEAHRNHKRTLQQITDIHNLSIGAHERMKQAIKTKKTMMRLYEENKERKNRRKGPPESPKRRVMGRR